MEFRSLRADEIECRVSTCSEKGVSLLLYKDARCDMRILDEVVGPEKWTRSHEVINGNLFCNVSIHFDGLGWVTKQDVGTESYTEKEKGQASDSFKRACFNWGIGRELYTAPFVWIPPNDVKITEKNGKKTTYDKFVVERIATENGEIVALTIRNDTLKRRVFEYDRRGDKEQRREEAQMERVKNQKINPAKVNTIRAEISRTGTSEKAVLTRYKKSSLEELTEEEFIKCMNVFQKMPTKKAG